MIYVLLTNHINNDLQVKIIKFLKLHFENKIPYKLIFNPLHIIEKTLDHITNDDYLLFHPLVASNNLLIVKKYHNSIVILQNKTVLIQKLSKRNSINENMAINNGFKLMYIEPEYDDITNDDWKLVIGENDYLLSINKLLQLQTITS